MSVASGEVTNKITMKISWNFLSSLTMTIQGMLNEKDMSEVEHVTVRNVRTVQHEGSILNQAAAPSVNVSTVQKEVLILCKKEPKQSANTIKKQFKSIFNQHAGLSPCAQRINELSCKEQKHFHS